MGSSMCLGDEVLVHFSISRVLHAMTLLTGRTDGIDYSTILDMKVAQ